MNRSVKIVIFTLLSFVPETDWKLVNDFQQGIKNFNEGLFAFYQNIRWSLYNLKKQKYLNYIQCWIMDGRIKKIIYNFKSKASSSASSNLRIPLWGLYSKCYISFFFTYQDNKNPIFGKRFKNLGISDVSIMFSLDKTLCCKLQVLTIITTGVTRCANYRAII